MEPQATLRPLTGEPAGIQRPLEEWLDADRPPSPTVRTSGSTGEPKDVALSCAAVTASAAATLRRLGGPGQWVLAVPVRYVAGLQVVVRSPLAGTSPVREALPMLRSGKVDHRGLVHALAFRRG